MYLVIFPYHMKPKARNVGGEDTSKPEKRNQTHSSFANVKIY